jgi:SAM-dependent methyltransferase
MIGAGRSQVKALSLRNTTKHHVIHPKGLLMNDSASIHNVAKAPHRARPYLPAMGRDWLLPLYDPFTRLLGVTAAHRRLADQAELGSAARVLEIGCGTGNLALMIKRMRPQLDVAGLDPDPRALARAGRKARRSGLAVELDQGFADQLPYLDASFDRVLSALMFHHLEADLRLASLREVVRVLRPGGTLHLVDLGGNSDHLHGLMRRARHSHTFSDNFDDRIPALMAEAGLLDPAATGHLDRRFGTLTYYRGARAA